MSRSNFSMKLECFAGQSIEDAVKEMPTVATRLGVWVTCNLNGIHVIAAPDDSPDVLWGNYEKARDRKATFVSANVIPRGRPDTEVSP